MTQNKTISGYVLKELPAELEKASDDELWAVATVECPDEEGDIVRVDGMSLDRHRPERPLKILAQHMRKLPDGKVPVIGRVEEFRKSSIQKDGQNYKAVLFKMSWAKDKKGNLLPLAKEYKDYYDGGYMTDFSIGASVIDGTAIKGGGTDFTKTSLSEISGVTMGAHQFANKIASELEEDDKFRKEVLDQLAKLTKLYDRFDRLESLIVTKTNPAGESGDSDTRQDKELNEALTHLSAVLNKLSPKSA